MSHIPRFRSRPRTPIESPAPARNPLLPSAADVRTKTRANVKQWSEDTIVEVITQLRLENLSLQFQVHNWLALQKAPLVAICTTCTSERFDGSTLIYDVRQMREELRAAGWEVVEKENLNDEMHCPDCIAKRKSQ